MLIILIIPSSNVVRFGKLFLFTLCKSFPFWKTFTSSTESFRSVFPSTKTMAKVQKNPLGRIILTEKYFLGNNYFSKFYSAYIHQVIDNGIDGQTGNAVYLQLTGDVAAVSDDGVGGNAQMVAYLLVAHALNKCHDNVFFAVAQHITAILLLT